MIEKMQVNENACSVGRPMLNNEAHFTTTCTTHSTAITKSKFAAAYFETQQTEMIALKLFKIFEKFAFTIGVGPSRPKHKTYLSVFTKDV